MTKEMKEEIESTISEMRSFSLIPEEQMIHGEIYRVNSDEFSYVMECDKGVQLKFAVLLYAKKKSIGDIKLFVFHTGTIASAIEIYEASIDEKNWLKECRKRGERADPKKYGL